MVVDITSACATESGGRAPDLRVVPDADERPSRGPVRGKSPTSGAGPVLRQGSGTNHAAVHKTLQLAVSATFFSALSAVPLMAEDEVFLSGAHLSYTALVNGEVKADGKTTDWDSGLRIELHLRDYYFDQQTHHPFAELGVFYEEHEASNDTLTLDTETIALRGTIGSAIPLWRSADGGLATGIAPELGMHIGSFSVDANSSGLHSDDDAFRYGASAGINAWFAYRRSVAVGLGVVASYWRATSVDIQVSNGQTVEDHDTKPSGWDVGLRFSVGFMF